MAAVALALPACGGGGSGEGASSGSGGGSSSTGGASTSSTGSGGAGGWVPPACEPGGGALPGFHVAPLGTPSGDGSPGNPWDLATALNAPAAVKPGDTIWLRGGAYPGSFVSKLVGADGAPITVRSYPGEWAVIDSNGYDDVTLQIYKEWTTFQDLEIMNSDPHRLVSTRFSGIYVEGKNIKLINLIVHDVGTGVICNSGNDTLAELAPELEVYGSIFFNNGWFDVDTGHGHHLYLQNRDGRKHIRDNIIFNAFGFGIHAYSDTDSYYARGYEISGNVWFQNGAAGPGISKHYDDCMVGHNGTHPVADVHLSENYGWASGPDERDLRMGWSAPNEDASLTGNYLVGTTIFQPSWNAVTMSGNTFYGPVTGIDTAQYPDNTYLTARPTGAKVVVRPNAYQPGRAHIIVYNWDASPTVDVDLSSVLLPGATYEVRNAQDWLAPVVASGTYSGGSVPLPMAGLSTVQPIGLLGAVEAAETTGADFNVFVLIGCGGS